MYKSYEDKLKHYTLQSMTTTRTTGWLFHCKLQPISVTSPVIWGFLNNTYYYVVLNVCNSQQVRLVTFERKGISRGTCTAAVTIGFATG